MGFGLYTTARLVDSIGKEFILHSGHHKLIIKDGNTSVIENGFWQGTLIYMEIGTGEEIDPNQVVDHRACRRMHCKTSFGNALVGVETPYDVSWT